MRVFVVLGMHRSGTSLLANFLNAAGVYMGNDFGRADEFNAEGYWESTHIVGEHEKILAKLKYTWDTPVFMIDRQRLRDAGIEEMKRSLIGKVRSELAAGNGVWGFKDPRTLSLLPLWNEIFDEVGAEPSYVLSIRHPGSVAASLARRDGMPLPQAYLLWLAANMNALFHAGSSLRAIVDYDLWLDAGLEQSRTLVRGLDLPWNLSDEKLAEASASVVNPGLRHHRSERPETHCEIVDRFYSLLVSAASSGKIPEEAFELTSRVAGAGSILGISGDFVAEHAAMIVERDKRIRRYRRKLKLAGAGCGILAAFLLLSLLVR
ncbi:MAG: hypothetical protein LLG06_18865 [Desulfobacteraceae bacterium]|nr:hypothetical protein [Desulfobacteraceae bacterium]